jgi:hypothetical protein
MYIFKERGTTVDLFCQYSTIPEALQIYRETDFYNW